MLSVKLRDRVDIKELQAENGILYAQYERSPDHEDLNEKSREEMLVYIKNITNEISTKFSGGEQYQKVVNDFNDLNSIMVYLSQFLQIPNEERYELLKIQSLKERSLRFLDYLLKTKGND